MEEHAQINLIYESSTHTDMLAHTYISGRVPMKRVNPFNLPWGSELCNRVSSKK